MNSWLDSHNDATLALSDPLKNKKLKLLKIHLFKKRSSWQNSSNVFCFVKQIRIVVSLKELSACVSCDVFSVTVFKSVITVVIVLLNYAYFGGTMALDSR